MPPRVLPADTNYVPVVEPVNTADRAPQHTCGNRCVASGATNVARPTEQIPVAVQPPPGPGEYIDIDVPKSSSEDGSLSSQGHSSGPAANPPASGSTAQPALSTQPVSGSQGGGSRSNVAHDINHFFRRGKKNVQGDKTVCIYCE